MNDEDCNILKAFIRNYRPDLVRKAQERNTEMAAALLHGMLKSGFPAKDFETSHTTIINIIKPFVGVSGKGRIFKKKARNQVQFDITSTPGTEQSAKKLYEYIKKRKGTGQAEQRSRKKLRCKYFYLKKNIHSSVADCEFCGQHHIINLPSLRNTEMTAILELSNLIRQLRPV